MCSNISASPAYGVYISQLIRYARASSNYSDFLKRHLHLRNRLIILLSLRFKCIAYNFFCRDGIYFDKILVSEYKLFKRSNKANLFIALVQ
jgi:hypothetical protein